MSTTVPWTIRPLAAPDLPEFRRVRLDALHLHPHAYGSSYEEEVSDSLDDLFARWPAPPGAMLGAFIDARLVGIAGLQVPARVKQRHKGFIYTVYVEEAVRGRGLAEALVRAAIDLGRRAGLDFVWLTVAVGNDGARRIYERLGFRRFGIEPRGLKVDGIYVDEEMMALDLDGSHDTAKGQPMDVVIEVCRLPHGEGLPLPAYATAGAAGMDLLAAVAAPVTVAPGQRALIPTGLTIALPRGYELQVRPRSGLALRNGIVLPNSPGTIDEDYRGEVQVIVLNAGDAPFTVERGMRIAQAVVAPVVRGRWNEVATLDGTSRGTGGFGSTGT